MAKSLRSRLIFASILWTGGMLMLMHLASMAMLHVMPRLPSGRRAAIPVGIGLAMMAAGFFAAVRSLTPFRDLRNRLLAVRRGQESRVTGQYPSEVAPLVEDMNALLDQRERAVRRAHDSAGDLAHGLKTPLALLAREAEAARAAGLPDLAASIAQQVSRMSAQINLQLARARATASANQGTALSEIGPCVEALMRALTKIHAARAITLSANIAPNAIARIRREDLDEILGNLLDNACKWARSRAIVTATQAGREERLTIIVDDDGAGLTPDQRMKVQDRGVRLDESAPGSGLGLAISRDLAELYGGTLFLTESPLGGLRANVTLPSVSAPPG